MFQFVRWPEAVPKSRPSVISAGLAMLLHVAAGAVLLTVVRLPAAPEFADDHALALVFAPPQSVSPEPSAPPAMPGPPAPAEIPAPPEMPAEQPSPPEPLPPPPAATTSSEAPPAIARPPVTRRTTRRMKPVAPPRIAAKQSKIQPHPSDLRATRPSPQSSAAETPVAADWQLSLATWLAAHKTYPDDARRRGLEGKVALRLTIDRSGHLVEMVLVRSAGASTLDKAAEALIRNAVLPPFTAGMSQATVTLTVQLNYAMTD